MPPAKKLKILFVTSEVVPFIKTGGLADVSSALPQKLQELGHLIRIVVPKYGAIDERKFKIHEVVRLKDLTTKIGNKEVVFSLRSSFLIGQKARVQIYFLDNPEYFGMRHSLYSDPITGKDYADNDERFILLAKSVFALINKLGWVPDVIHCNDWQGGLIPAYLKTLQKEDETLKTIKTLFTVHNLGYQGEYGKSTFAKTGLPDKLNSETGILQNGKVNFLKAGLQFADFINTVSESYAKEICSDDGFSNGLKDVLAKRKKDVFGIINGIDTLIWNPEKDKIIAKKYSAKTLEDKLVNKKSLSEKFGLKYEPNVPLLGMISRLEDSKGFDLIQKTFKELMGMNIKLIVLGTGDRKYHKFFEEALFKHKGKFACYLGFDDGLAHFIEAGSDIFLMPSLYEPCGLNQMYSLVYGTVPLVRDTGGLADTVQRFKESDGTGNGFSFKKYTETEFLKELKHAIKIYTNDKKTWTKIQKNGMKSNFTWLNSSKNYIELYKKLVAS
ncbi:MAG: glycogen synthase GlgA [Bacteroidetes bacterium]|nr:glycogen synthase GlgA [Bacteroidota bacterium]MBU1679026.1 glycogen synthase GlgA [Bacteroidota bacterium]MBU2506678.1 glycogen synthase GlgA [Bacteroidota bacterium]